MSFTTQSTFCGWTFTNRGGRADLRLMNQADGKEIRRGNVVERRDSTEERRGRAVEEAGWWAWWLGKANSAD